ncbi:MAG: phosphonate metabolism protein/1,5-bisphosphokinase (PRPP-forming) PhnN [Candidatus Helarchaeota archaeon]
MKSSNRPSKDGILILTIGNSGSGKDSLIKWALDHWPKGRSPPIVPTRVITRPPAPETETYESITQEQFHALSRSGAFSLQWKSYGIDYGVRSSIEEYLSNGRCVLVNVSRQIVEEARARFSHVVVIFIRVPFHITEARIRERGREQGAALLERLERAKQNQEFPTADYIIDNSGTLEKAGHKLLEILLSLCP